ncbi:MAG: molybdenum cofactor biosynthesis protein MoaE [Chitinophagales bacterium]|nr:molybdenum cofactor biosynthesis protein MoaE [Chitinophagales bacterium]
MKSEKKHKVFVEGPVSPSFIAESIEKHNKKFSIGAHSIFLGQVRNDKHGEQEVAAIEYTSYREMAEEKFHEIREDAFKKFPLICMHIYHSLGVVKAGEISLMVFTSSVHRKDAMDACEEIVERIKKEVPVWGKEIFSNENTRWKINN